MSKNYEYDVVVIGSGPNGLSAAIALAGAGLSVIIFEGSPKIGGGLSSAELTLPGFTHDLCSGIHPLGIGSPFFRTLPLEKYGLSWVHPPAAMIHPFSDGSFIPLEVGVEKTAQTLGEDANAYLDLMKPLADRWDALSKNILSPYRFPEEIPGLVKFGLHAIRSAEGLVRQKFKSTQTRAFFAGLSAHSNMPLNQPVTAAFGLVLALLGHNVNWPYPRGGAQKFADSLAACFKTLGGNIVTGHYVQNLDDLPPSKAVLMDLTPRQALRIAGHRFPSRYKKQLEKFKYGPGIFKIDWALEGPVPFKVKECGRAATIHIGGSFEEISESERLVGMGEHPEHPYIIFAQHTLFDDSRAPKNKHTAWGYCHVPAGSTEDMTERMEKQIERFAPGFRDLIVARHTMNTVQLEQHNPNMVGGDINGGMLNLRQFFIRPALALPPYKTPVKGLYFCSSSTPPGGGVHGMSGFNAAKFALKEIFNIKLKI